MWLCWLFRERNEIIWRFGRGSELEVRTATYGPEIGQSQYAKSLSHTIKHIIFITIVVTITITTTISISGTVEPLKTDTQG